MSDNSSNSISLIQQAISYRPSSDFVNESFIPETPSPVLFAPITTPFSLNIMPPLSLEPNGDDGLILGSLDQYYSQTAEVVGEREEQLMNNIEYELNRHAQTISHETICSICMSDTTYFDLSSDHLRFTTVCGHVFCIKCIAMWVFTKVKANSHNQTVNCHCPMCRTCFYTHQS